MLYTLGWIVLGVTCGAILLLIGAGYLILRIESRGKDGLP